MLELERPCFYIDTKASAMFCVVSGFVQILTGPPVAFVVNLMATSGLPPPQSTAADEIV